MTRKVVFGWLFFISVFAQAQITSSDFRSKKIIITKDSIRFDSVPINPQEFKVFNSTLHLIEPENYQVLYNEAILIIDSKKYQEITLEYFRFPSFLTETFSPLDDQLIVPNNTNTGKLYSLTTNKKPSDIKIFDGLKTSGFISRGITSGNNQNAVTNSSMDLNIEGKLSKKVGIRANIFDTNIPLQENGYSQSITDFDRIFIELFSDDWRVKAGDVSLKNDETYFLNFEKQVSGIEVEADISKKTNVLASGAIVRGQFTAYNFVGVEGNQGPYKIFGPNNEPNIVIVSGSDRVFVNGSPIKRGENAQYTIDYNIGEIRFNTTYPITNDMRIRIEFQYSDRNYTRFITYDKASYKSDRFSISGYFYSENDAKNSPIQVSLTTEQKQILANAGNNPDLMVSESAYLDSFDENKILYRKALIDGNEVFEYSTDSNEELYNVTFTNVGVNQGDYVIDRTLANGSIYQYVGSNMGSYAPIIRLVAPTKLQVAVVNTTFSPWKKSFLSAELALSNNDQNLFSSIDNNENTGSATQIHWQQTLIDKKWQLESAVNYQFVHHNFKTVQRFQAVEFNRDWNITNTSGNLQQLHAGVTLKNKKDNLIKYEYQTLKYSSGFDGSKHILQSKLNFSKTHFFTNTSFLQNDSDLFNYSFLRVKANIEQSFTKSWAGASINIEKNEGIEKATQNLLPVNHQFKEYEGYFGVGDSTKVYAKFGVNYRTNDSIRNNSFTQINARKTFYAQSQLIQNKRTNLSLFANYRITQNTFTEDEKTLNSKIIYTQKFFDNFLSMGSLYETSSGNVARQDFIYVETEPGQGFYTWIDYNEDGLQDFDEFEIAEFQDQANYLRLPLPNLRFVATQKAKWNQSIALNASQWKNKNGIKKLLSHFYNQLFLSIDNKQEREGNTFNFNPFSLQENKQVSLLYSFRNSLSFNRNLRKYSTTYTFSNIRNKQQLIIGSQENKNKTHQVDFEHKLSSFWLFQFTGKVYKNDLITENFDNRNFEINAYDLAPKFQFEYNENHRFSIFYHFVNKQNNLADFESLTQNQFGVDYFFLGKKKQQFQANATAFVNNFEGNSNSPVGYQMLEGLQNGANYTWSLLWNQKLNSYLHLNINYRGRKSKNTRAIHTGTVQLRAIF